MWFMLLHVCFFFFKQKTAYEMRISDWSSDVCSSDLRCAPTFAPHTPSQSVAADHHARAASGPRQHSLGRHHCPSSRFAALLLGRSEEHTSELQSLMRSSYDVFCLKTTSQKSTKSHATRILSTAVTHYNKIYLTLIKLKQ